MMTMVIRTCLITNALIVVVGMQPILARRGGAVSVLGNGSTIEGRYELVNQFKKRRSDVQLAKEIQMPAVW